MADFRKLTDVESVEKPVETANVLIEENGVIKKAPKTAVGGAGGDYDLVLRVGYSSTEEDGFVGLDFESGTAEIVSGSFEAVAEKVDADTAPRVLIIENFPAMTDTDMMPLKIVFESKRAEVAGDRERVVVCGEYSVVIKSPEGVAVFCNW